MEASVERTYSYPVIGRFVLECFYEVTEDSMYTRKVSEYVNTDTDCWLMLHHNGACIGVVQLKPYNSVLLEMHPFIGKQHRKYSEKAIKAAIKWFNTEAPEMYESLITNIPSHKRHVIWTAYKTGFKKVGAFKSGFREDGKAHDMLLFQQMRVNNV